MYQNYIFDLYGTLVDIHTNEKKAYLWEKMSLFFGRAGNAAAFKRRRKEGISAVQCTGAFHRTGNFPARPDEIL